MPRQDYPEPVGRGAQASPDERRGLKQGPAAWFQSAMLGAAVSIAVIVPRLAPFLLGLLVLTLVVDDRGRFRGIVGWLSASRSLWALAAFALWAVISALWSASVRETLDAAGLLVLTMLLGAYASASLTVRGDGMSANWRQRFLRAAPFALVVAGCFLLVELVANSGVTLSVLRNWPQLMGDRGKGVLLADGQAMGLAREYFNRNVAALVLLLFPALAAGWLWLPRPWRLRFVVPLVAVVAVAAASSESETAKLALVTGLAVLAPAWRWPEQARRLLGGVLVLGLLLVPLLARLPVALGLERATWLPASARSRLLIWDYTGEAIWRHPLHGIGVRSTKAAQQKVVDSGQSAKALQSARRPGSHAHNVFLQVWFELGAIGALLLCAGGLALLAQLRGLDRRLQAFGAAYASTLIVASATGWGAWQEWYLACMALGLTILALCASLATGGPVGAGGKIEPGG